MRTPLSMNSLMQSPAVGQIVARLIFILWSYRGMGWDVHLQFLQTLEMWLVYMCSGLTGRWTSHGPHEVCQVKNAHKMSWWELQKLHNSSLVLACCFSVLIHMDFLYNKPDFFFEDKGRYLLCLGSDIWLEVLRAVLGETFLSYGLCDEDHVTP